MNKYIISVVDSKDGAVVSRSETSTLKGRTFKHALQTANVSSKGTYKFGDSRYIVYVKEELGPDGMSLVAKALHKYQADADTLEHGLEWRIFHDMYLSEYERTQLVHCDELRAYEHENELQAKLTAEDRRVAEAIAYARTVNDVWKKNIDSPDTVTTLIDGEPVTFPITDGTTNPKYHRINKGA